MKKNLWSVMAVLLVLAVASVSAYHMNSADEDDVDRVSDSRDRDCDINPYDSIDTCASRTEMDDDRDDDRMTVSDTWSDRMTVSDVSGTSTTASQWIMLRCRASDDTTSVSDRGETRSTFGRTTARTASDGSSDNNVFDRNGTENTSDERQTVSETRTTRQSDIDRVNTADLEMLECYVVEGSSDTYTTVSDTTAGDTRGFESPVVYSGTLDTQRTADNTDANDVIAEDGSGSNTLYRDNTGRTTGSAD